MARAETTDLDMMFDIKGQVADVEHTANYSGYTFRVALRGIGYDGHVHQTLLEAVSSDRWTVWLALRDVGLTIARTEIAGDVGAAECGPMKLVLGTRRELWIALDLERRLEGGRMKLALQSARFGLPSDNWSVGSPAWVQTSGFGMSRGRVVSGLRNGLATRPQRIEQQLINAAPAIFAQLESQLPSDLTAPLVASR